jgi:CheY-like chemotaxis protein
MVGDILDASSLATGKLRLDAMPVDVVRLFADATSAFQTAASAAGIALEFDCTASACVVSGDAERLRQMLSNLVSNALKFTPAGGAVTVTLTHDAAHAVLAVGDTGQGIASEFIPYVFDMFRRADGSPASPRRGLGLGLSIVRHIAELHGGEVRVDSGPQPRRDLHRHAAGRLAADRRDGVGVTQVLRDAPTLDTQRILIVDDDATTRDSLAAALTTLGAVVAIAVSGRAALDAVATLQPTVVLSDLAMPDGDGFWLIDALRRRGAGGVDTSRPRVLAVTAHAGLGDERRALDAGFDGYLCKPVDVRDLAHAIARVAARWLTRARRGIAAHRLRQGGRPVLRTDLREQVRRDLRAAHQLARRVMRGLPADEVARRVREPGGERRRRAPAEAPPRGFKIGAALARIVGRQRAELDVHVRADDAHHFARDVEHRDLVVAAEVHRFARIARSSINRTSASIRSST